MALVPASFRPNDQDEYRICFKQPEDAEELARCDEAMESCPVEAIGNLFRLQD